MDAIEKSRNVKLSNFIYALGIKDIGFSRAKLICKSFNNDYDKIKNLTFQELSSIDGIGEIIAQEWIDEFNNEEFKNELDKLIKEVKFIDETNNQNKTLEGLTFVITGTLNTFENRDKLIEYIESLGGKVVSAISNKVNYLINNDKTSTSTKNTKAKELNISIISEEDFRNLSAK